MRQLYYSSKLIFLNTDELLFDIGNTSVTLYLEARAHNVYSGTQSTVLSTKIKFVRIDENNDPIPISERVKNKYRDEIEKNK